MAATPRTTRRWSASSASAASIDCSRLIELTPAEYEQVRNNPCRFAIVNGHEISAVESVVERHDRYAVVRKRAGSGELAKETDPRA